jgi:integrase
MEELSKHPRLARRGQVYWFRAKVPADLRLHYAPKQEITFSLRTRDLKDALEKVRVEAVKLDQEFAAARRKQAEQPQTTLSDIEIERLSAIYLQQLLQEDEEVRRDGTGGDAVYVAARDQLEGAAVAGFAEGDLQSEVGMSEREYAKAGEALDIVGDELRWALARGRTTIVEEEVDELLAWNSVRLDKTSESYRKLSSAILKASVTAHGMQARRHRGEVVDTPRAPAPFGNQRGASAGKSIRFSELFEKWKKSHQGPTKTKDEFGVQVRRFIEVNGDLQVHEVMPAHVRDFKDAMILMPARLDRRLRAMSVPQILEATKDANILRLSPRTVREKSVAAIRAVLARAVDDGDRADNPASGIRVPVSGERRRPTYPFTIDELNKFFASPVFMQGERTPGCGGEAAKWLPLLALFTGARLEELAQLEVSDVRVEDGVQYIFIGADPDLQRVKNEQSRRKTPLHPELKTLGFLEYVASVKRAGKARLFPEVVSKEEKVSAAWSKWFGRYRKRCGITGKGKVFHSFRHSAKRAMREAGIEKPLRDALMGHAYDDEADEYGLDEDGLGVSIRTLYEALSKLHYPRLDLMHLYPRCTVEN